MIRKRRTPRRCPLGPSGHQALSIEGLIVHAVDQLGQRDDEGDFLHPWVATGLIQATGQSKEALALPVIGRGKRQFVIPFS